LAARPTLAVLGRFSSTRLSVLPANRPTRSRRLGEPARRPTPPRDQSRARLTWPHRRPRDSGPAGLFFPDHLSLVGRRHSPSCRQDLHTGPSRSTKAVSQFILPLGLTTAFVRAGSPIARIERARKSSIHVSSCRVSRRNSLSLYADRVSGTYFDHVVDCVPVASANGCKSPLPIAMTVLVHEAAANDRE